MLKKEKQGFLSAEPATTLTRIKTEPMVFSADFDFAYKAGGVLTRVVLDQLEDLSPIDQMIIDTRVHMLKPGWLPAIGGWHCDAIPRGADGQPDFSHPRIPDIKHYLFVLDAGTGSLTQFADVPRTIWDEPVPDGRNTWGHHSELIQASVDKGVTKAETSENGALYSFDAYDYHKALPATGDGWRFFLRASVNTLTHGPFNEVRKQVQTYIPSDHLGW